MAGTTPPKGTDPDEVLDLEALVPLRRRVKFPGGEHYEMLHHNELGIVAAKDIQQRWEQILTMLKEGGEGTDLSSDEVGELNAALNDIAKILVPSAPAAAIRKLDDKMKYAIVEAFYKAVPAPPNRAARRARGGGGATPLPKPKPTPAK